MSHRIDDSGSLGNKGLHDRRRAQAVARGKLEVDILSRAHLRGIPLAEVHAAMVSRGNVNEYR
jgi:hypothetical protein